MTGTFNVLKNVRDFAPGAFENTAVEAGSIQLGHIGKGYLEKGSYTAPPFTTKPFMRLIPSWNADTPEGTSVEVQARVATAGHWSRWFSFGQWSPYIDRASPEPDKDELVSCDAEILQVLDREHPADTYQMRILLRTECADFTPMVRLLAISVDSVPEDDALSFDRELEIPTYSCLVRDPAIDERMAGACSVTMMLNRWGEDLLPEEVARAVYDSGAGRYANLSFLSAVAGTFGFESFGGFGRLNALRREVWRGSAVAAKVRYRAPSLGGEEDTALPSLPVLEEATVDSPGHLVVVRGFVRREDGAEYVVVNDPMAPSDSAVRREIPVEQFSRIYLGIYLMLHNKSGAGLAKPRRKLCSLEIKDGAVEMRYHDKVIIPGGLRRATICYTLTNADSLAYPSAAKKKFYYPHPDQDGTLRFDARAALGSRLTLYVIGSAGDFYVAEKLLREEEFPAEPEPEPAVPADQDTAQTTRKEENNAVG